MKKLVVLVAMAGCVSEDMMVEPETAEVASGLAGEELQGRLLLGSFADTLAAATHFRVAGTPTNRAETLSVTGASLVATSPSGVVVYTGAAPQFVGVILPGVGPSGGELEITGVTARAGFTSYRLIYRAMPGGDSVDYCAGAGSGEAVPMQGRWSLEGLHINGPGISFGCENAVTHKCTRWGYIAGGGGEGTTGWDHHQACTRMARADYCADGKPHTYELTPIAIRDLIPGAEPELPELAHPASLPAPPNQYFFEGAWRAGSLPPLCLSKTRWASLPIGSPCPAVLPDPRKNDGGAKFCDDMTMDEMAHPPAPTVGALVFNASKTNDMMLQKWSNGLDTVMTVRGFYGGITGTTPPFHGYNTWLGSDGIVLRNLPGSILPSELKELRAFHDPVTQDRVIARPGSVPGSYVDDGFEGWTFNSSVTDPGLPARVPFRMFHKGDDRVTSVGGMAAPWSYDMRLDFITESP